MEKLKHKLKDHGGFTLIEMLIVVAIIAILIAIGIPMVNTALENAREATDSANERSALGLAMTEVMANNQLAKQPIDTTKANVAYYVIGKESKQGALKDKDNLTGAVAYGKGTKIGEVTEPHVGGIIEVTYDPTVTDETKQFSTKWVTPAGADLNAAGGGGSSGGSGTP